MDSLVIVIVCSIIVITWLPVFTIDNEQSDNGSLMMQIKVGATLVILVFYALIIALAFDLI